MLASLFLGLFFDATEHFAGLVFAAGHAEEHIVTAQALDDLVPMVFSNGEIVELGQAQGFPEYHLGQHPLPVEGRREHGVEGASLVITASQVEPIVVGRRNIEGVGSVLAEPP